MENWERLEERKRSKKRKKKDGIQTAELDRRDQVTATGPGPVPFERGGTEVDYQVAAPTEMRTPNLHRAINRSIKECGWKDGDRGGPAQMQNLL
jgi:hypothetical protein